MAYDPTLEGGAFVFDQGTPEAYAWHNYFYGAQLYDMARLVADGVDARVNTTVPANELERLRARDALATELQEQVDRLRRQHDAERRARAQASRTTKDADGR